MSAATSPGITSITDNNSNADRAEALKTEANRLFQIGHYQEAADKYTDAIALNASVAAYFSNRAFAQLKLENYGYAIADADEALKLDSSFIKGYYRRASAYLALSRYKEALRDFRTVVKYVPQDRDARNKLTEVEKIVRQIEFAKALSYDVQKPKLSETLNVGDILVEDGYDGMRWEDNEAMTVAFVEDMVQRFERQKRVHRKYAYRILLTAKQLFDQQATLVDVHVPRVEGGRLTVCGDTHGQFYDLLNIFRTNGMPSPQHAYLFNGDFVDRGSFSIEVVLNLLAYKCLYPETFHLSRGNHETDNMNRVYGFEGECRAKYNEQMFALFSEVFEAMPLAFVIDKRVMVVHGGLFSRDDVTLEELRKVNRFQQPPNDGLMCEMLWADPMPAPGRAPSKRGVGLQFGPDVTKRFLELNNLDLLVRSHEVKEQGYVVEHDGRCVTVFSAPNYCDQVGNKGAVINITLKGGDGNTDRPPLDYQYWQFEAVPHPPVRAMAYANSAFGL